MGYIAHDIFVAASETGLLGSVYKTLKKAKWCRDLNKLDALQLGKIENTEILVLMPDGSKEGWNVSHEHNHIRNKLISFASAVDISYTHLRFGGDHDNQCIRSYHDYSGYTIESAKGVLKGIKFILSEGYFNNKTDLKTIDPAPDSINLLHFGSNASIFEFIAYKTEYKHILPEIGIQFTIGNTYESGRI